MGWFELNSSLRKVSDCPLLEEIEISSVCESKSLNAYTVLDLKKIIYCVALQVPAQISCVLRSTG